MLNVLVGNAMDIGEKKEMVLNPDTVFEKRTEKGGVRKNRKQDGKEKI